HLREPGHEYKETIRSGCLAAAAGGFTSICAMPNTDPVNDNRQTTEYILKKATLNGPGVHVFPIAAITKGLQGKSLCEYGELKDAGAIAFSDDGRPVMDSQVMRRAMENANEFNSIIISHSEDLGLSQNGVMNEGTLAAQMGLAGIPNAAESIMVMRDIALCELTRTPIHIAHVSTRESVYAIRDAKTRGIPVTAETAPHYLTLCEDSVKDYNTNAKMNPPLRSIQDREAVLTGLADGTIDAIASDHAPHSSTEKEVESKLRKFCWNGVPEFDGVPIRADRQIDTDDVFLINTAHTKKYYEKKGGSKFRAETNLFRLYGVTPEQFDNLYVEQEGCCAICGKHQSEFKRALDVDHDHKTKVIRGLLCSNCNIAIGKLKDNPVLLRKAADYLEK
ncbi:hypothetical protein LCGC14_2852360, partial [marine sediment metagenome]